MPQCRGNFLGVPQRTQDHTTCEERTESCFLREKNRESRSSRLECAIWTELCVRRTHEQSMGREHFLLSFAMHRRKKGDADFETKCFGERFQFREHRPLPHDGKSHFGDILEGFQEGRKVFETHQASEIEQSKARPCHTTRPEATHRL